MTHAVEAASGSTILVDKFLDAATEVDVDCIADYGSAATQEQGEQIRATLEAMASVANVVRQHLDSEDRAPDLSASRELKALVNKGQQQVADVQAMESGGEAIIIGVMEHIEEAGIHSGDSACALPPYSLPKDIVSRLKDQTRALAKALRVRGLMNVQYAIKNNDIYVIEVNPRASRTVPFVGKATGVPWAKIAAKVMAGKTLKELNITEPPDPKHVSVKEVVFPFSKFPGVDVILGPEMRSTGEVMGIDQTFEIAFAKSQIAAGGALPKSGTVFISVRNEDKQAIIPIARQFQELGFEIMSSAGTYTTLSKAGIETKRIPKLSEGRPNIADFIKNGQVQLLINTPTRKGPQTDEGKIRAMSVLHKVPIVTTLTGASAAVRAIAAMQKNEWDVRPLQEYFEQKK
jgi:carbamoyl-phosphate synthase large subunit